MRSFTEFVDDVLDVKLTVFSRNRQPIGNLFVFAAVADLSSTSTSRAVRSLAEVLGQTARPPGHLPFARMHRANHRQ